MARKPAIHDIARLAGISKSIASGVLNNGARVNPITGERSQPVLVEQDFMPDRTAMQLACGDHQLIHTHSPGHLITLSRYYQPVIMVNMTGIQLDILLVSVSHAGGACLDNRHLFAPGHELLAFLFPKPDLTCFHERYHVYSQALWKAGKAPVLRLALYDYGGVVKCLSKIVSCSQRLSSRCERDQCATETPLSLLNRRFALSRNWLEFAVHSGLDWLASPDRHVCPSCHIWLPRHLDRIWPI